MPSDPGLEAGQILSNKEICEAFRCSPVGRMRRSRRANALLLFYDPTEIDWTEGVLRFPGTGRRGNQRLASHNKTLYESDSSGVEVFLFRREGAGNYTFEGRAGLAERPHTEKMPDEDGNPRDVWMFPLRLFVEEQPALPVEPAVEPPEEEPVKKRLVRAAVAVAVCGLIVLAVFWLAALARGTPEKTVNRFFKAVECRDAGALAETLSGEPRYAGGLAATLGAKKEIEIRVILEKGVTEKEVSEIESLIKSLPEVSSYHFTPERAGIIKGGAGVPEPAEFRVRIADPNTFSHLYDELSAAAGIAADPDSGQKRITFPMVTVAQSFLSRIIEGARFGDITYKTVESEDRALVAVAQGDIYKVDESGRRVAVTPSELESLAAVPSNFLLEKRDGGWYIVSFPEREEEK